MSVQIFPGPVADVTLVEGERSMTVRLSQVEYAAEQRTVEVTTWADQFVREIGTGIWDVEIRGVLYSKKDPRVAHDPHDFHKAADFLQEQGWPEYIVAAMRSWAGVVPEESSAKVDDA